MEKEKFGKIETEQRNSYQILTEKLLIRCKEKILNQCCHIEVNKCGENWKIHQAKQLESINQIILKI